MKTLKRLLCLILAITMVFGTATGVYAGYEDGRDCPDCGHYHWDEYMCGKCGTCSAECTSTSCFLINHCNECGECFSEGNGTECDDCLSCMDCYINNGYHCLLCWECYYIDEESLCGNCWQCEGCTGFICNECGWCRDCRENEGGMHCDECDNCYNVIEDCQSGGEHCIDCCVICENCEGCLFDDGGELCIDCGLCLDCCFEEASSEGCDCGVYCVLGPGWSEHVCISCGNAFCNVEQCEICGECLDCCMSNSDCSEGMCIYDDDYDTHFCEDCGDCFDVVDICESCYDEGSIRCQDCCLVLVQDAGCDCFGYCISDPYFEEHINGYHAGGDGGSHDPTPKAEWIFDTISHWKQCKYCDEEWHQYIDSAPHELNKYGVCVVCGYDIYAKIIITRHPDSRVCKVTDNNADKGEKNSAFDNHVYFTASAFGLNELSYQWYYKIEGDSRWTALEDDIFDWDGDEFIQVHGSNTERLTVAVGATVCYETHYYKCVVTDSEGNVAETAPAALRSPHIFDEDANAIVDKTLLGIIHQLDSSKNIGIYETPGHILHCIGDGCDVEKTEAHRWSKVTAEYVDFGYNMYGDPVGDGATWYEYTCYDCGAHKYLKDHEHYFIDPETEKIEIDYSYENSHAHKLKCLFKGCEKTTLETHTYMGWEDMGAPSQTYNGVGVPYRECSLCSYQNTKKPQIYDKSTDSMKSADWTGDNDLVYVKYGAASEDIIVPNQKFYITFSPTDYDKTFIGMENPKCITWDTYYTYEDRDGNVTEIDVTDDVSLVLMDDGPKWQVQIFGSYTGGGIFEFVPVIAKTECAHERGTYIKGAYDPVCVKDGYTGDRACVDCGKVVEYGEEIECVGYHTGTLTLNPLSVREGSCTTRGYTGTSKCSECKMSVRGRATPKKHTGDIVLENYIEATCYDFGYSGDEYCGDCGELLKAGKIVAPEHQNVTVEGYVAPTSDSDGYSGDLYCDDCGLCIKYGYTIKKEKVISVIEFDGEDFERPTAGDHPYYDITEDDVRFDIERFGVPGTVQGITWYNKNIEEKVYPTEKFIKGYTYSVGFNLEVNSTYAFASDLEVYIGGELANVEYFSDPRFVRVEYTFDYIYTAVLKELDITMTPPVPGGCSIDFSLPNDSLYFVNMLSCLEDGEDFTPEEGYNYYTAGKNYIFLFEIVPKVTYGFPQCEFDPDMTVTVNGRPVQNLQVLPDLKDGFLRFSYDFGICGRATVSGSVTSYYSGTDPVTIQLIPEGTSEVAYETVVTGNSASYSIDNVPAGSYNVKVMKKNHATREYEITVNGGIVVQDAKIHLLGDVNGDGRLNTKDSSLLKSYIGNLKTLDEYQKKCFDINSDGRINTKDTSRIKSHITNIKSLWE